MTATADDLNELNALDTSSPMSASHPASGSPIRVWPAGWRVAGDPNAGHGGSPRVNIGQAERQVTLITAAGLAAVGVIKRGPIGLAMLGLGGIMAYRSVKGHCMLYDKLGINAATSERPDPTALYEHGVHLEESVVVAKPADELYDFWRDLSNHPKFMANLKQVATNDAGLSHWVVEAPTGGIYEWDAEIIADDDGRSLSWRTVGAADAHHAGTARFNELKGDRGTQVTVEIQYLPPTGAAFIGKLAAKLFKLLGQDPSGDLRQNLHNFKHLMETGELPTNEGQPRGHCGA